tara:strand:+ start:1534 stop:1758 length:225 start_codon:yes stop_codon:yes gene_type:complete
MKATSFLRYIGNTLLVIGHFTLLWGSTEPALIIKIIGGALILPFAIGLCLWDVVALELVFGSMDVTKLIQVITS